MRFMVMVKASPESEENVEPSTEQLEAMSRYNEELVNAGVLLDANGLTSSADGAIVSFTDGEPTVIDGPFTEAKELVAGYWVIEVKSREEIVEWVKRVPFDDEETEVEIRPFYEADDFGPGFTEDLRERQDRMTEKIAEQRG
ncbi:MAG TPA: YciI family protein [Actinophytocola sp.]|nr:YciI family protein [Actinophytocola sp.]